GLGSRIMALRTTSGISARAGADAGITHAVYEMNRAFVFGQGPGPLPADVTDQALPNTYASFSYHVQKSTNTPEGYCLITSTGTAAREEKTVYAFATITNLFEYALIVTDDIVLKPYTLVDAYDSNVGYPSATDYPLKIGTNSVATWNPGQGAIDLGTGTIVEGDVLVGVGGHPPDVIRGEDHATTGLQYPLSSPFDFEHITAPTIYDAAPLNLVGSALAITAPLGYTIDNPYTVVSSRIDIGQAGTLTVVGHVALHVTGDITFGQGAEMYVGDPLLLGDPNWIPSSLTIYLDGNLYGHQAGGINNLSEIPADFKLFGTGPAGPPYQDWDIKNSRNFYGVYYGENADIIIRANADVFGSVSGHSFDLRNSGNLHYDVRLSELSAYDTGFRIERWWEE
ncbi:MAG: DUF7305 domain-containing protein, partial [Planctomycetota bacterium]